MKHQDSNQQGAGHNQVGGPAQPTDPDPGQQPELNVIEDGAVTSAAGFRAAGVHAGFRRNPERLDLALVEAEEPCTTAGVFTQNVFCAAPVRVSRAHLGERGCGTARAVVINSGVANAATGERGLERAERTAKIVADAVGCDEREVLVASTGVIGVDMPIEPYEEHVPALHQAASAAPEGGHAAARAIMTTDTHPKEHALWYASEAGGSRVTVGGMSKGSGMIMPNMATMIAVLTTDAALTPEAAHQALADAVGVSFNKVTVDSDTSTNDTCILMASGRAWKGAPMEVGTTAFLEFERALEAVCVNLARQMAADGEGSSKLVTVNVRGAASEGDADAAARAVANSPLVKTAIFGHDANWGRIAAALGKSGASFRQEDVDIDMLGMPVLRAGLPVAFSEEEALRRFEEPEVVIDANLGAGDASATVWTCDLTHDYVSINGDYRS